MPTGYKRNPALLPLSSPRVDHLKLDEDSLINGTDDLFGSPSPSDASLLFGPSDLHALESGSIFTLLHIKFSDWLAKQISFLSS
jgi:hypothetical protein